MNPVTAPATVRAALPAVTETSVAEYGPDGATPVIAKRSPQLAAWPATVTVAPVALRKSEPASGGAPGASVVTLVTLHGEPGAPLAISGASVVVVVGAAIGVGAVNGGAAGAGPPRADSAWL